MLGTQPIAVPPRGTVIGFRPITGDDVGRLRDAFDRLSPVSRYRRFLGPVRSLSDTDLHAFTHVDFVDHVAWVAESLDEVGQPLAGVGRWIRSPKDATVAEVALTVVDAYQRQGLGTALLGVLAAAAVLGRVEWFEGTVLADNQPMRSLLRTVSAKAIAYDGGTMLFRLPVSNLIRGRPGRRVAAAVG